MFPTTNISRISTMSLMVFIFLAALLRTTHALPPNVQQWRQYLPFSFEIATVSPKDLATTTILPAETPRFSNPSEQVYFQKFKNAIRVESKRGDVAVKLWNWAKGMNAKNSQPNEDFTFDSIDNMESTTESSTVQRTENVAEKAVRSHRSMHRLRIHRWI
ncbi:hypothetical protein DdX_14543 [Ditylenchus destructor]|uniref:Secreted protein n=1 Tax=Ditylenchus destructor TaxID=166010 RepID=A0AAD4MWX2_9BILA|nr:hypothetical protein DdX_14543 [Ditylenchus destructor]